MSLNAFGKTSGTIDNVRSIKLQQFRLGGMEADSNATINVTNYITIDGSGMTTAPGFGFYANGGTISCPGSNVIDCEYGFYATMGGKLLAAGTSATGGTTNYYATDHAFIYANSATHIGGTYGFYSIQGSFIDAQSTASRTAASLYDYAALSAGTVDATSHVGGEMSTGVDDGSYVIGF